MEKLKNSQSWVIGETIVVSVFTIVSALAGLTMMKLIKLTDLQQIWVGRVALAFALLAFFYTAYLAAKQRSN